MYTEGKFVYEDNTKKKLVECLDKSIESFTNDNKTSLIMQEAFKGCYLLKELHLDKTEINIDKDDTYLYVHADAFKDCPIKTIYIGNVKFNPQALNSKNLKSVIISENATEIDSVIFYDNTLNKAPNLEEIVIENNTNLQDGIHDDFSVDGVWYQKSLNEFDEEEITLIFYPAGKKDEVFMIPEFVDRIDNNAFFYNPYIKEIVFPKSYNNFYNIMINSCKNLEAIVEEGMWHHPEKFIKDCKNLKEIYTHIKDEKLSNGINYIPLDEYKFRKATSFKKLNELYKKEER